jgi:hypothetical protein
LDPHFVADAWSRGDPPPFVPPAQIIAAAAAAGASTVASRALTYERRINTGGSSDGFDEKHRSDDDNDDSPSRHGGNDTPRALSVSGSDSGPLSSTHASMMTSPKGMNASASTPTILPSLAQRRGVNGPAAVIVTPPQHPHDAAASQRFAFSPSSHSHNSTYTPTSPSAHTVVTITSAPMPSPWQPEHMSPPQPQRGRTRGHGNGHEDVKSTPRSGRSPLVSPSRPLLPADPRVASPSPSAKNALAVDWDRRRQKVLEAKRMAQKGLRPPTAPGLLKQGAARDQFGSPYTMTPSPSFSALRQDQSEAPVEQAQRRLVKSVGTTSAPSLLNVNTPTTADGRPKTSVLSGQSRWMRRGGNNNNNNGSRLTSPAVIHHTHKHGQSMPNLSIILTSPGGIGGGMGGHEDDDDDDEIDIEDESAREHYAKQFFHLQQHHAQQGMNPELTGVGWAHDDEEEDHEHLHLTSLIAPHVEKGRLLADVDHIKLKLAQATFDIPRGVLERSLLPRSDVHLSYPKNAYHGTLLPSLVTNPFGRILPPEEWPTSQKLLAAQAAASSAPSIGVEEIAARLRRTAMGAQHPALQPGVGDENQTVISGDQMAREQKLIMFENDWSELRMQLADVVPGAEAAAHLKAIMWAHYDTLRYCFRHYSSPTPTTTVTIMNSLKLIQLIRQSNLLDAHLTSAAVAHVMYQVKSADHYKFEKDPLNLNGNDKDRNDPFHPVNQFSRAEFMQALFRMALVKFQLLNELDSAPPSVPGEAFRRLCVEYVGQFGVIVRPGDVRQRLLAEEVQRVFKKYRYILSSPFALACSLTHYSYV